MLTLSSLTYLLKRQYFYELHIYDNVHVIEGINKFEFKNILFLATQESYFLFNDVLYKQKDGVAMGSPLGPTMANVFLSFYEVKWLEQSSNEFKPVFYRRYVDNIFVLFKSAEYLSKFRDCLNTCHSSNKRKMANCPFLM